MTTIIWIVWAVLASALVFAEAVALIDPDRLPTVGDIIQALLHWPLTRWMLLLGWLWLGWHLFVRR